MLIIAVYIYACMHPSIHPYSLCIWCICIYVYITEGNCWATATRSQSPLGGVYETIVGLELTYLRLRHASNQHRISDVGDPGRRFNEFLQEIGKCPVDQLPITFVYNNGNYGFCLFRVITTEASNTKFMASIYNTTWPLEVLIQYRDSVWWICHWVMGLLFQRCQSDSLESLQPGRYRWWGFQDVPRSGWVAMWP